MELIATPLLPGKAAGIVLAHPWPLSFWGGVDPASAAIIDGASPRCGQSIAGRVLVLGPTRGSSSSSSILLELIRIGRAPAAIVVAEVDAILPVGIIVAREMSYAAPPLLLLAAELQARVPVGAEVRIAMSGRIEIGNS